MAAACALAMCSGKMFLIQQFGASADAPNCVFHRKEQFYFMISQKRTAAQCAAVLFDAFSAKTTDYSAAIAPVGQAPSQAPQSMQESAFTTAAPFSMVIAPTGQAPSQAPQPTHASETLCAIINSPFLSRADVMYEETYLGTATHAPRNLYPCLHSNKAGRKRQD